MASRAGSHPEPNGAKMRVARCKRRRLAAMSEDPGDALHGTVTGYGYGCRCERCRAAKSLSRFARIAQPGPYVVEAEGDLFAFDSEVDAEVFAGMHGSTARRCRAVRPRRRKGVAG